LYQRSEFSFGHAGVTATLSLDQIIGHAGPRAGLSGWIERFSDRVAHSELAPDLGTNIGSLTWFRGLATCASLCWLTVQLAPGYQTLPGAVPAAVIGDAWEQTRTQSIAPQAWGGDTGHRMAASDIVVPLASVPERPTIDLVATLGEGDGFARVLERAGVGGGEAQRVAGMVAGVTELSAIKPGTAIRVTLGRRPNRNMARPIDALDFRARFDLALSLRRDGGTLVLHKIPIAVDHTPLRIQGQVGDSLYRSARAAGAPPRAIETYIRAIAAKLSLDDVSGGARYDIIVERARAATGEVETGRLLYAGLERGGRRTQLLQWTAGGRTEWFEASGVGQKRAGLGRPVNAARMTSGFGMRFHPLLGYTRMHQGIDYAAAYGSAIYAVSDGIVSYAGRHGGHGNYVRLSHAGGLGTGYAHMSRILVSGGTRVAQGQVIGYVGSTGLSTGPHLHFETYRGGAVVNPAAAKFATSSLLDGADLANFRARLRSLLSVPVSGSNTATATASTTPARKTS
jgi:murein DD-endopeptidase MepM/ murein hydrolase activator NlpD